MSAIFTPVFRKTAYLYHECSECGKQFDLQEDGIMHISFYYDDLKFCPYCGKEIIRFDNDNPKYLVEPDMSKIEPLIEVFREAEEHIKYIFWCVFTEKQRKECKELFKCVDNFMYSEIIKSALYYTPHHSKIKKLNAKYNPNRADKL